MKSSELRQKFLSFFEKNGHKIIPSASLFPENDFTTLFIGSGMQPLIPYLLGESHPKGVRLCNSQKSFRVEDIEEVGDGRHTTFFEMLGNWSLGDYFKKEQLNWIYSFLVDELKLDINRIYASVFIGEEKIGVPKDTESVEILKDIFQKYGIEAKDAEFIEGSGMKEGERIFYYPAKKNWWSKSGVPEKMPLGEIGGPDSEIFYDLGTDLKKHENSEWVSNACHINCDCGRFIEIGNSVFIQYKKTQNGFEKLDQQNVDFGGGFERLVMVEAGLDNIFQTDLFLGVIEKIEELSGKKYNDDRKSFEVIADHLRAAIFIMADDKKIGPSNTGQGYIVRRLIRRAVRMAKKLEIAKTDWMVEIAKIIVDDYKNVYNELENNFNFICTELAKEEAKFEETLEKGMHEFEKGGDPFILFTTYGFPIELTLELAKERGREVNLEDFNQKLKKHQELSRTASAGMFKGGLADHDLKTIRLHTAHHLLLSALQEMFGKQVKQRGSNINQERLRIDFSFDRKLTDEEKKKIEDIVNKEIKEGLEVERVEMPKSDAEKIGAEMEFGVKYGDTVSVYFIKDKNGGIISKEFCGGPHVNNTSELGKFKIIKEEASSQGVRRIKAILE